LGYFGGAVARTTDHGCILHMRKAFGLSFNVISMIRVVLLGLFTLAVVSRIAQLEPIVQGNSDSITVTKVSTRNQLVEGGPLNELVELRADGSARSAERQALLALAHGDYQRAITQYEIAVRSVERRESTVLRLAELYYKTGNKDRSIDLFRQIKAGGYLLNQAKTAMQAQHYHEAEALLRYAVEVAPDDGDMRATLGSFYWSISKTELGAAEYRIALRQDPCRSMRVDDLRCIVAGARLNASEHNWEASILLYNLLLAGTHGNAPELPFVDMSLLSIELARVWRDGKGDKVMGNAIVEQAREHEPTNLWLLIAGGKYYQESGYLRRAAWFYRQAGIAHPNDPYPDLWQARLYLQQSDLEGAKN
jgi:tetratricopeptide (TPR) repeat protein